MAGPKVSFIKRFPLYEEMVELGRDNLTTKDTLLEPIPIAVSSSLTR